MIVKNKVNTYFLIIFLFYCTISYFYWDYAYDDTYIYAKYIKNLSNGDGFCFNIGEISYGCTSILWTFVGTFFAKVLDDPVLSIKWLSYFFRLISILIFYKLSLSFIKDNIYSILATLSLCITPWFLRDVASGLETNAAIFVILLGCYIRLNEKNNGKTGYFSTVLFSISFLLRPECALLLLIIFIDILFIDRPKDFLKQFLKLALIAIIVILPFQIYAFLAFKSILPNTVVAKYVKPLTFYENLTNFLKVFGSSNGVDFLIFFSLMLINIKKEYRIKNFISKKEFFILLWIIVLALSYFIVRYQVKWRYLAIITPLIIIISFGILKHIVSLIKIKFKDYSKLIISIVIILLFTQSAIIQYLTMRQLILPHKFPDLVSIGKWIDRNTPQHSVIAAHEIGAIGYYSNRKIIDIGGLASTDIIPFLKRGNEKAIIDFLRIKKADYFVDVRYFPSRTKRPADYKIKGLKLINSQEVMTTGGRTLSDTSIVDIYKSNWNISR